MEESNFEASYYFKADDFHSRIAASLVWNIDTNGGEEDSFDAAAKLYNLDLLLYDMTDDVLWSSSAGDDDNTETIWNYLNSGHDYKLQVSRDNALEDFVWDYALSWQISSHVPIPGTVWLLGTGLVGLAGLMRKFRKNKIGIA